MKLPQTQTLSLPSPLSILSLSLSLSKMQTLRMEPQALSPCGGGRRSIGRDPNSPEFEFWMVRNPSLPPPNLLSADELFVDGVLLPLRLVHHPTSDDDPPDPPPNPEPEPEPKPTISGPQIANPATGSGPGLSDSLPTASKRWKDIFKKSEKKSSNGNGGEEKEKKKERKSGGGGNAASSAELNINIWPFSRSRSAGNGGARPRTVAGSAAATRKVSSAPCSRSNSAGESKSRKWPSSPSRGGVHLGRSSPVWQVRRGGSGTRSSDPVVRNVEKGVKKEGNEPRRSKPPTAAAAASVGGGGGGGGPKAKVLTLNVPMCIGYRHHLSCRSDENSAVGVTNSACGGSGGGGQSSGSGSGDGGRGGNLFNLRGLFTKKVY